VNNKNNQFSELIYYSGVMLKEAEGGNWHKVISVEKQRNNLLKELFLQPFTQKEKNENKENILQVLDINKKLEAISSNARDEIRSQAGSINKGRQALDMYAQHT